MQSPPVSSRRDIIQQTLMRARNRMGSFAAAFVARSGKQRQAALYFDAPTGPDGDQAKHIIERSADIFFSMCRDQRDAIIRNRVRSASDGPLLCRIVLAPVRDAFGELVGIFVAFNPPNGVEFGDADADMSERMARLIAKAIAVPRDPLTKLLTHEAFARAVAEHRVSGVLLYGDIDQLHVINDLWGLQTGDAAIARVGEVVRNATNAGHSLASRLSGDRFTVFIPDSSLERGREIAEQLRSDVTSVHVAVNAEPIPLSMCWGVAAYSADATLDHGLAAAELACKAAKDRGRNRVEIYHEADASIIKRHDDVLVVGYLRTALAEGRFRIFAQPIARLMRGEHTRRFEMLVRLIDENDNLVMPQKFISSATRYQLLPQLDHQVIEYVLAKLRDAKTQPGFIPVQVSLNLSGPTISDAGFADWLIARIAECGIPGDWLAFELTENAAIANLERAQALITRLSALGCKFALDDFGTGVNSLAYLKALQLTTIKIDGSFIRDLLENERSESLVRGIAQLATAMGIETVAEYVESPMLCMRLIELGVQFGQGYALGRPIPLERILDPATSLALAS